MCGVKLVDAFWVAFCLDDDDEEEGPEDVVVVAVVDAVVAEEAVRIRSIESRRHCWATANHVDKTKYVDRDVVVDMMMMMMMMYGML